jgi:hypothetical protein
MSGLDPETLEETQARLAAQERTPYGPAEVDIPAAVPAVARRTTRTAVIAGLVVGLIAVAGVVAAVLAGSGTFDANDPAVGPAVDPVVAEHWQSYPGSAFRTPEEVFASPPMDGVIAQGEAFVTEFRTALTEQYGLEWTTLYEPGTERDYNGYGGESLLYRYDSGLWHGVAIIDDPNARAEVEALFVRIAAANGGDGAITFNDFSEDNPDAEQQYGAKTKPQQPLWSFIESDDASTLGFQADVYDATVPADPAFDGLWRFELTETGTLYVTVQATAYALLAEGDRDEFERLLEAYAGQTPPELSY